MEQEMKQFLQEQYEKGARDNALVARLMRKFRLSFYKASAIIKEFVPEEKE